MLEKLENLENRFKELSDLMIKPEILSDQKKYIQLSKEYKELKKIIDQGQVYRSIPVSYTHLTLPTILLV